MIVKLKDISKSYAEGTDSPRRTILKSFNLSIDFHESISIVGPSGCGKQPYLIFWGHSISLTQERFYSMIKTSLT